MNMSPLVAALIASTPALAEEQQANLTAMFSVAGECQMLVVCLTSGQTTQRINSVIKALARRNGDFEQITPTNKAKFTKLLKHNEFDVMALVHLFDEIQSSDPHLIENATRPILELAHDQGSPNDE